MEVHLLDLRSDYVELVGVIAREGDRVTPRGLPTRELADVTLILDDVTGPLLPVGTGRGVNQRLAAVEALSLVGGVARPELLLRAAPSYDRVLVSGDLVYGAYGLRVRDAVRACHDLLRRDPATRQAVALVWRAEDLDHVGDVPCTVGLHLTVRDGELRLATWMRSQDAWLGLAYDVFVFTQLQHTLARCLGYPAGRYTHHVTSLHLYERDLEAALRLEVVPIAPVNRPLGLWVRGSGDDVRDAQALAARLLDGDATVTECRANPWYSTQLARLGVCQPLIPEAVT